MNVFRCSINHLSSSAFSFLDSVTLPATSPKRTVVDAPEFLCFHPKHPDELSELGARMQNSKKPMPLATINGIRKRINTEPDFQRPPVWATSQKQLLVDTILRNYDVPKLYWRKTGSKPDTYDVVDGQQRLRAIWDFFDGNFKLPKDAEPINASRLRVAATKTCPMISAVDLTFIRSM
jgi:hypothetical protein